MSQKVLQRLYHFKIKSIPSHRIQLLTLFQCLQLTHLGAQSLTPTRLLTLMEEMWLSPVSVLYHSMTLLEYLRLITKQISTSLVQQAKNTQFRLQAKLVTIHRLLIATFSTWLLRTRASIQTLWRSLHLLWRPWRIQSLLIQQSLLLILRSR